MLSVRSVWAVAASQRETDHVSLTVYGTFPAGSPLHGQLERNSDCPDHGRDERATEATTSTQSVGLISDSIISSTTGEEGDRHRAQHRPHPGDHLLLLHEEEEGRDPGVSAQKRAAHHDDEAHRAKQTREKCGQGREAGGRSERHSK